MNTPQRFLSVAAWLCAAAVCPTVSAQTDASTSRADVKAETRAANKSGQLPAGEAGGGDKAKPTPSTKTRAERKAETLEAAKKGDLQSPGQQLYKGNMSQRNATAKSTKTRAERKAETKQAAKEGKLPAAGEASDPAKK